MPKVSKEEMDRLLAANPGAKVTTVKVSKEEMDRLLGESSTPQPGGPTDAKGKLTAFTRNLIPGLDYIDAASEYVQDRFPEALGGRPDGQERSFDQALSESRAYNTAADQANPVPGAVGSIAQAYAAPWSKATGLVGVGQRIGQEALAAYLMSRGKGSEISDALKGAATTGALAGVGEGAISAAKGIRSMVSGGLKRADTVGALNAVGAVGSDFADLRKTPAGKARIGEIANDLHAEGVIKPFRTVEQSEDALEAARKGWGKKVGDVYDQLDQLGAQADMGNVNAGATARQAQFAGMAGSDNAGRAESLGHEIKRLGNVTQHQPQIPLKELHDQRVNLDDLIYKYGAVRDPASNLRKTVLQGLRGPVQDEIDRAAQATAAAHAPQLGPELTTAAKKYGTLATATEWAKDAASKRDAANVIPWLAAGSGVAAGGAYASGHEEAGNSLVLSALGALLLRKQIEPRLPATISAFSHKIVNTPAIGKAADAIGSAGAATIRAKAIDAGEQNPALQEYLRSRGVIE